METPGAQAAQAACAAVLRAADTEDLLGRLGSSELVNVVLDLLSTCEVREEPVPGLKCRILFRSFDSNAFVKKEGAAAEPLLRSLSGEKDLSLELLLEDTFQRYLRNVPADFLVSGNDPAKSRRIAGAALLTLPGPEGLCPCGVASVERALRSAFQLDVARGSILVASKEGLGQSYSLVRRAVELLQVFALPIQTPLPPEASTLRGVPDSKEIPCAAGAALALGSWSAPKLTRPRSMRFCHARFARCRNGHLSAWSRNLNFQLRGSAAAPLRRFGEMRPTNGWPEQRFGCLPDVLGQACGSSATEQGAAASDAVAAILQSLVDLDAALGSSEYLELSVLGHQVLPERRAFS
ncbi:unnamed protein product [Effrenium voratum]|uniref:Uncharacterized protein n=1 Tax=Effrenium voratum TaxID=2562239 RepID=A0AA36IY62_9DINO|nr:unnamed protein product [Effrenium voratum]